MNRSSGKREHAYQKALAFHRRLQEEIDREQRDPVDGASRELLRYYRKIRSFPALRPFYERNWVRRLLPAIEMIDRPGMRVLDAGCGVGTEALLFAELGAEVTAVDLHPPRIEAARRRIERAGTVGRRIELVCGDISRVSRPGRFDVVWSMESISHIDPPGRFVGAMRENLRSGGILVITDSNGLNPWLRLAAFRGRGRRVYEERRDAKTGMPVRYANERLLTVTSLHRLLARAGFAVESTRLSVFIPPRLFARQPRLAERFEEVIAAVPGPSLLGGVYAVVARR